MSHDATKLHSAARGPSEERAESWVPGPSGLELGATPPPERWEDWLEPVPGRQHRRVLRVPFACDNCDAGCGLLGDVDANTVSLVRVTGNPLHPASKGRTCAAGPATLSQVRAEGRILHPLRRVGERGEGRWERISWEDALDQVAAAMREAIEGERVHEILVQQGGAEPDPFTARAISAWGLDALSTDTTASQLAGGLGLQLWMGSDALGSDFEAASAIVLVGSPRDGSPLHPDPKRILQARRAGAKLIVIDPVRSNLAAHADIWLAPRPGTETVLLLAIAHHLISQGGTNRDFMRRWWNWMDYMEARYPGVTLSFPRFELALQKLYSHYGFEFAEKECGVPAEEVRRAADMVLDARERLSGWCGGSATEGNLGGWQVSRSLFLLCALIGAVGVPGSSSPASWLRFQPELPWPPPPTDLWNTLSWPSEFPLACGPNAPLLPWMIGQGRGKLSVFLSDRYNPVRTSPNGFAWLDLLKDPEKVALHAALTPTWNESAVWADLVLPVGFGSERHGLVSSEAGSDRWIALRQPVIGVAKAAMGLPFDDTRRANPGQVWEEDEVWIHLAWRLDPAGQWGIREAFESRQFRGERLRLDEYYGVLLERGIPELAEVAAAEGLSALQYLRKRGAFQVDGRPGSVHERTVSEAELENVRETREGRVYALRHVHDRPEGLPTGSQPDTDARGRIPVGIRLEGDIYRGFSTPSGKLEFYSPTLAEWGWPEQALPTYVKSHVHQDLLQADELVWVPIFEAPEAEGSVWSLELAHANPLWINPKDAARLGLETGDPTRVETEIGHFVTRAWVTESVRPGVVGCNPTRGRWRLAQGGGPSLAPVVSLHIEGNRRSLAREEGVQPGPPSSEAARAWWSEGGVPVLLAMPVHPDPVTGAHCWNQVVRVRPAQAKDLPGDATADMARAARIVELWLQRTRRAEDVSPDKTRRPRWLIREPKPGGDAWKLPG